MSQVNITLNTNTVDINTTNNQIVVTDPTNPNVVNITQPVTSVVEVITAGPQGTPGAAGAIPNTGSFATTGSNNFIGNQTITGSLTVSGSNTFTNIGPAVFSGSINVTQGISGSFSGSFKGDGSLLTGVTGEWDGTLDGNAQITGSLSQGTNNLTLGNFSHAEGESTITIGDGSHAEGYLTSASAAYSHAEGDSTIASGPSSHAEGYLTQTIGDYSHAEGELTETGIQTAFITPKNPEIINGIVTLDDRYEDVTSYFTPGGYLYLYDDEFGANYGYASFLISAVSFDGTNTIVELTDTSVNTSQAYVGDLTYLTNNGSFGGDSTIPGHSAHSEGAETKAIGSYSHTKGSSTYALGVYSHAEGILTQAIGEGSHAEGDNTQAKGNYSHAEGSSTTTNGDYSHAEGESTIATGPGSHAEGNGTLSLGDHSHAEGHNTEANGVYSHAEGVGTRAIGNHSHAEGEYTQAIANSSHAEGLYTIASARRQHVQGMFNITSSAEGAFILGNGSAENNRSNLIFAAGNSVQITGSLTVSGSNTFTNIGPAVFSGSIAATSTITAPNFTGTSSYASSIGPLTQDVSIVGNLNVIGTSSFTYSTASIIQVGSNTILLNTDNPASRFGGITVVDSGSFGNSSTGSIFWDSLNNKWIYSNPSGSSYDGGMLISGPRNTSGLGNEQGTTNNALMKGQGGDHITSSAVFEVSGSVGIGTSTPATTLDVRGVITTQQATLPSFAANGSIMVGGSNVSNLAGVLMGVQIPYVTGAFGGHSIGYSNQTNPKWLIGLSRNLAQENALIYYEDSSAASARLTLFPGGNLAINSTTDAGYRLDVNGTARMGTLRFLNTLDTLEFANTLVRIRRVANGMYLDAFNGFTFFDSTSSVNRLRITQGGNVLINTTTDAGYRLDVNGTARVSGQTTIKGTGATSATTALRVENTNASASLVVLDNGFVGIGTSTPTVALDVVGSEYRFAASSGAINFYALPGVNQHFNFINSRQNSDYLFKQNVNGAANTSTLILKGLTGNILINSATDTGHKLLVSGSGTSGSLNVDGTLYVSGSRVGIGTSSPTASLDITGTARVQGNSFEVTNGTNKVAITSTQISCLAGVSINNLNIVAGAISMPNSILGIGTTVSGGTTSTLVIGSGNATNSSGTITIGQSSRGFAPTSGTATFSFLTWNGTINQTGGANGITRGLYINPTLTSASDFRAIETTQGRNIFTDTTIASGSSNAGSLLDLSQTWNTTGTPSAIKLNVTDTASNGSSFLLDLRVANTQLFGVTKSGFIAFGGAFGSTGALIGTSAGTLNFYHKNTTVAAYGFDFRNNSGAITATSSESGLISLRQTFSPTSGTGIFNAINLSSNLIINQTGGANGITRGLYVNPTLTAAADFRAIETTRGNVLFQSGSTPLLFVSESGNIGVGLSNPTYRVHVSGSSTGQALRLGGTGANYIDFLVDNRSAIGWKGSSGLLYLSGRGNGLFIGDVSSDASARLQVRGSGATSATTALRVENTNASASLVVLDNGTVGIGTNAPAAKLEVNDGIAWVRATGGALDLGYSTETVPRVRLARDIVGPAGGIIFTTGGAVAITGTAITQNGNGNLVFLTSDGTGLYERVRITSTGNLLINTTTNAGFKLDVSGSARITSGLTVTGSLLQSGSSTFNGVNRFISPLGSTLGTNLTTSAAGLFYQTGLSGVIAIGGYSNGGGEIQTGQNGGISVGGGLLLQRQGGNVAIGTSTDTGRLTVRGSGATSATTTLLIQNSTPTNILTVLDNGTVGIGRTPTQTLDIAGTTRMSGSFNTAASGSILTVVGSGSAQPIFTVLGSQGELFSITDSLSGSLFSVNDISGLPILEVFSDSTTLIGDYLDPMLITTKKVTLTNSGSFTVYSLPTASYDTAFFDYSVRSGSNARAGQIMAIQSASSVNFTEVTSSAFGTTTDLALGVFISGSNMVLTGSADTTAWTIKTIIRSI